MLCFHGLRVYGDFFFGDRIRRMCKINVFPFNLIWCWILSTAAENGIHFITISSDFEFIQRYSLFDLFVYRFFVVYVMYIHHQQRYNFEKEDQKKTTMKCIHIHTIPVFSLNRYSQNNFCVRCYAIVFESLSKLKYLE